MTGEEVRETRSRVEGDRRVYEVQFQNDVYDTVEFTADLELPNPGEVSLPSITLPEAQMTSFALQSSRMKDHSFSSCASYMGTKAARRP